jgi:asparagine N-glycosylation enzyme membrane subunit Stt3
VSSEFLFSVSGAVILGVLPALLVLARRTSLSSEALGLLRWLLSWAVIGLAIPAVVATLYGFFGIFFDRATVFVWPTSL